VQNLEAAVRTEMQNRPGARVFAAGATGAVVSLRHGTRIRRATEVVLWRPRHPLAPGDED
ncbi:MAG: transcriptional regulator, partial [Actinobacteria bacterium]|nr:transcriptional regulator [Actinomycetota bacterium]